MNISCLHMLLKGFVHVAFFLKRLLKIYIDCR